MRSIWHRRNAFIFGDFVLSVILSIAKNLVNIKENVNVDAPEILPPFGRQNDK